MSLVMQNTSTHEIMLLKHKNKIKRTTGKLQIFASAVKYAPSYKLLLLDYGILEIYIQRLVYMLDF